MTLTRSLLLSVGAILVLVGIALMSITYQNTQKVTYEKLYSESEAIYNFLMAMRRVYQKQFLESGVTLSNKTVGFLPAHSIPRISQEFSERWDKRGIRINTASDRPRNPRNQADTTELEAMEWFNEDDERSVFIRQNDAGTFFYARPVWVVKSCLKCHGKKEDAPPSIQTRYDDAYNYDVGELRGVMSIRIPLGEIDQMVMRGFIPWIFILMGGLLLIAVMIFVVVHRLVHTPLQQVVDGMGRVGKVPSYRLPHLPGELGEFVGHFNTMLDRQDQLKHQLIDQRNEMEQILTSMDDAVVVTDLKGKVVRVNPKLKQMVGEKQPIGEVIETFIVKGSDQKWTSDENKALLVNQKGEKIPVDVSVGELLDTTASDTVKTGEVLVIHDLRERIRAEEQEEYAAYQAGIAEMATMVLHNIGNALTTTNGALVQLSNCIEMLKQSTKLFDHIVTLVDEDIDQHSEDRLQQVRSIVKKGKEDIIEPICFEIEKEGITPIEHSVQHITEIISIQQKTAHITENLSNFYLPEVIQDALTLQRDVLKKLEIEIVQHYPEPLQPVRLPKNQMVQVMNNLLKNAHESIASEKRRNPSIHGRIELTIQHKESHSTLTVVDNGAGVPSEISEKLFQYGFSSKNRGSGFGLHASANFIHSLGGEISLTSDGVGLGATITIVVPNEVSQ